MRDKQLTYVLSSINLCSVGYQVMCALGIKLTIDINHSRATIVSIRITIYLGSVRMKRLLNDLRWYIKVGLLKLTSLSKEDRERLERKKRKRIIDKILDEEKIVESTMFRGYGKTSAIIERLHKDKKAYMVLGSRTQLFALQNAHPFIKHRIVCLGKESLRGHDFHGASIVYVDELPAEQLENLVLATKCNVAGFVRH